MQQSLNLPGVFSRYASIGGVLDFGIFDDADGSEEEALLAIAQTLNGREPCDTARLRELGCRPITREAFLGDWHDHTSGQLIHRGTWRTAAGVDLTDPRLKDLDGLEIVSGGSSLPDPGSGGQFAFAYSRPPYPLAATPREVQEVFDGLVSFLLPMREAGVIHDWSSPHLSEVSPYFASGMEWWGVFLFSIHLPASHRLIIVAGSATD